MDNTYTPKTPWLKQGNDIYNIKGDKIAVNVYPPDQDFILKAVNNHYALIAALQLAQDELRFHTSGESETYTETLEAIDEALEFAGG